MKKNPSDKQLKIVRAYLFSELSASEIGDIYGISTAAVYRAVKRFQHIVLQTEGLAIPKDGTSIKKDQ